MLVEKLKENIRLAYHRGELAEALLLVESSLQRYPQDIWFHSLVGELLKRVSQDENSLQILYFVVEQNTDAYSSRLVLARLLENNKNINAFREYLYAIKTANLFGFWLNNDSTPFWCRQLVIHGVNYIERHRKYIVNTWLDELYVKYDKSDLTRVVRGFRMYSGDLPLEIEDKRQQPSFLYIPGIPARPVFPREEIAFADYYEDQYSDILKELESLLECQRDIPAYLEHNQATSLTSGGDWDALFFFRHGKKYYENHLLCPKISSILDKLPIVHISDHSPEVCFSVLRPNAHILPHRGVTNSRSVLHLGLKVPEHCRLNLCGIKELEWEPGKLFLFDDTYLHEAWNKSEYSRFVLLADVWNPFLTDVERAAISDIVVKIGLLNHV